MHRWVALKTRKEEAKNNESLGGCMPLAMAATTFTSSMGLVAAMESTAHASGTGAPHLHSLGPQRRGGLQEVDSCFRESHPGITVSVSNPITRVPDETSGGIRLRQRARPLLDRHPLAVDLDQRRLPCQPGRRTSRRPTST